MRIIIKEKLHLFIYQGVLKVGDTTVKYVFHAKKENTLILLAEIVNFVTLDIHPMLLKLQTVKDVKQENIQMD